MLLHCAVVFLSIVFEAFANSYFFAQASELGLLGGWVEAALVSFANVAFSMFVGCFFLRMATHIKPVLKTIGISGFALCMIPIGYLHLAIAHYRESLTRNPGAEFHSVLGEAWSNPFGLQDMETLLLIFIGVVITAIAIWKGYTIDDRYWGYGKVYRRWKELDDRMTESKRTFRRQVGEIFDDITAQPYGILEKLKSNKKELETIRGGIEAFFECCQGYYKQARNAAVKAVSIFRRTVHEILGDNTRFPFDESLVDGKGGLIHLGIENELDDVKETLRNHIAVVNDLIKAFPEKQRDFFEELENERKCLTSDKSIESILDVAKEWDRRGEFFDKEEEYSPVGAA